MALLPCLPVSVDDFRESLGLSAHLLTHVHSSNLTGLRDGWKGGKIYCTKVTRELLLARFDIAPSRVMPLSLNIEHVLPARDPATGKEVLSNLTLIDANHCPGSAMFLFKGESLCSSCPLRALPLKVQSPLHHPLTTLP
jgi:Cft2 family RNA processing exonuclease